MEEAVTKSDGGGGGGMDAPVLSVRQQKGEASMRGVGGVSHNTGGLAASAFMIRR